ncbi:UNVERIFIED_CONTAM: Phosphatidylserine decarboxylase proenzyme 2 [Sesamum radiatum]|uniref:Phosphatidylserine decarboxylase proenzyme 2 n=1 Tax=Sesamum radiatum TaxID=300843 RepID=A0AAW2MWE9_SESRA
MESNLLFPFAMKLTTFYYSPGRKFSIRGLLGTEVSSSAFIDGSLVIFRLAPQDYHRFHVPVSGTIEKFVDIPGCLYTVNPIAVNSKYCNVFTENKRVVSLISTKEFGKVAFVAIGATMVGSITFSKKEGDYVKKGDEFGYFSFGEVPSSASLKSLADCTLFPICYFSNGLIATLSSYLTGYEVIANIMVFPESAYRERFSVQCMAFYIADVDITCLPVPASHLLHTAAHISCSSTNNLCFFSISDICTYAGGATAREAAKGSVFSC